ncbi:CGNR zinc finger domain-containing protein [Nocardia sp. alder85J]|uniref:ABATE domain-containing protein n=1 Tax=Nocardia sp. alder85J TaxID=2862949 RepID=UPI001CD3679D|nr:CGNR zinc finger domain-containing protein [Nocardia sp. alder85J]MCX4095774.1 CGNR zinc finger domain-containing protein [Nocardia sp. alder85J]
MVVTDLDLAVELVNTVYPLATPPDRLTGVEHFRGILRDVGDHTLAGQLADTDLTALRDLRARVRAVFAADTAPAAATAANAVLQDGGRAPRMVAAPDGTLRLDWVGEARGLTALAARLAAALTGHLTTHGLGRLGVCAAAPCDCVFVDRTRPGTRKYCCDACNDRAAAGHYRRRRSAVPRRP